MKDTILQSLKFTTALATINLVFWFVVAGELERVIQIDNFGILIAFPIFIAAWVQYRTVLQIRCYKKEKEPN